MRSVAFVVVTLVSAALLAGPASAAPTIPIARYATLANSACAKANAKLAKVAEPKDQGGYLKYFVSALNITNSLALDLLNIPEPSTKKDTVGRVLSSFADSLNLTKKLVADLKKGPKNPQGLVDAWGAKVDKQDATQDAGFKAIGARTCMQ